MNGAATSGNGARATLCASSLTCSRRFSEREGGRGHREREREREKERVRGGGKGEGGREGVSNLRDWAVVLIERNAHRYPCVFSLRLALIFRRHGSAPGKQTFGRVE